jgi:hypothetical protein
MQIPKQLLDRPIGNERNHANLNDSTDGSGEDHQFSKHEECELVYQLGAFPVPHELTLTY